MPRKNNEERLPVTIVSVSVTLGLGILLAGLWIGFAPAPEVPLKPRPSPPTPPPVPRPPPPVPQPPPPASPLPPVASPWPPPPSVSPPPPVASPWPPPPTDSPPPPSTVPEYQLKTSFTNTDPVVVYVRSITYANNLIFALSGNNYFYKINAYSTLQNTYVGGTTDSAGFPSQITAYDMNVYANVPSSVTNTPTSTLAQYTQSLVLTPSLPNVCNPNAAWGFTVFNGLYYASCEGTTIKVGLFPYQTGSTHNKQWSSNWNAPCCRTDTPGNNLIRENIQTDSAGWLYVSLIKSFGANLEHVSFANTIEVFPAPSASAIGQSTATSLCRYLLVSSNPSAAYSRVAFLGDTMYIVDTNTCGVYVLSVNAMKSSLGTCGAPSNTLTIDPTLVIGGTCPTGSPTSGADGVGTSATFGSVYSNWGTDSPTPVYPMTVDPDAGVLYMAIDNLLKKICPPNTLCP